MAWGTVRFDSGQPLPPRWPGDQLCGIVHSDIDELLDCTVCAAWLEFLGWEVENNV